MELPVNLQIDSIDNFCVCYFKDKRHSKAAKSLISINKNTFGFLSKDCLIDCNQAELIPKSNFLKIIDDKYGFTIKERSLPENLKLEIVEAIKNSPLVSPYIKKLIDSVNL